MTTTTNILRIQLSANPCHQYEALSSLPLNDEDPQEIKHYVEELDNNLIYSHPYIFANNKINVDKLFVILSRGHTTEISMSYLGEVPKERVLSQICTKMLTSLEFLYCSEFNACFNPF